MEARFTCECGRVHDRTEAAAEGLISCDCGRILVISPGNDLTPGTTGRPAPPASRNSGVPAPASTLFRGGSIGFFRAAGVDVFVHWLWFAVAYVRITDKT